MYKLPENILSHATIRLKLEWKIALRKWTVWLLQV